MDAKASAPTKRKEPIGVDVDVKRQFRAYIHSAENTITFPLHGQNHDLELESMCQGKQNAPRPIYYVPG